MYRVGSAEMLNIVPAKSLFLSLSTENINFLTQQVLESRYSTTMQLLDLSYWSCDQKELESWTTLENLLQLPDLQAISFEYITGNTNRLVDLTTVECLPEAGRHVLDVIKQSRVKLVSVAEMRKMIEKKKDEQQKAGFPVYLFYY